MKVLVLGPGAREHALVNALAADPEVQEVVAAPGNPGMAANATLADVDANDSQAVVDLATRIDADLVVIGPEAPLVAGVADALREASFPVFGPSAAAAMLEGSKTFAKEIMNAASVPTARAVSATSAAEVDEALESFGAPYVVKADGLAAGKGVVVTEDLHDARAHAHSCLQVSDRVVIEEYLDGPEISLFAVCDGTTTIPLAPAQDFKRVGDGDAGPNTGGMGAYSPLPWAPHDIADQIISSVARPVVDEMRRRSLPFSGILFCGLALTSRGLRVIEFNVRFGDPETQAVLARLETPLAGVLMASATGDLDGLPPLQWSEKSAVTVVMAAENYPEAPRTGDPIEGLRDAADIPGVRVLHAGTREEDGAIVTSGGRVLSVVALGEGLAGARDAAYRGVDAIAWPGEHHRHDIAAKAEAGQIEIPARAKA